MPFSARLIEGIRCIRLFRKYKAEQKAELQAERDKIEAERDETQRMMQELLQMKAQMAQIWRRNAGAK